MTLKRIGVTILGSTGSIGVNTLDVISCHSQLFEVIALSAKKNAKLLLAQCLAHRPYYAVLEDAKEANDLQQNLRAAGVKTEILCGAKGLDFIATNAKTDYLMAAIVGAAGLLPTLAATKLGKRILLANKEALVIAGSLLMRAAKDSGAIILPVDSEHSGLFQCMPHGFSCGQRPDYVKHITLTASGGPFRTLPLQDFATITKEKACSHPTWIMGQKISVDCATMMNKGFEVIEAHWLFNMAVADIEVLIHPQSIVHALVSYKDGSVLAQLASPDMRTPIAYALAWPGRIDAGSKLDLLRQGKLEFLPVAKDRYPCLGLAYAALEVGGTAPAILNAANEVAVEAFLSGKIAFNDIFRINATVLEHVPSASLVDLATVLASDSAAREVARGLVTLRV